MAPQTFQPKYKYAKSFTAINETESASIRMIYTVLEMEKIVEDKWKDGELSFEDGKLAEYYLISSLSSFSELHQHLLKKLRVHHVLRQRFGFTGATGKEFHLNHMHQYERISRKISNLRPLFHDNEGLLPSLANTMLNYHKNKMVIIGTRSKHKK